MRIKLLFFDICYIANIITILTFLLAFLFLKFGVIEQVLLNNTNIIILRAFSLLLLLILWIKCLVIWAKYDKNILRFFLLFFLHGFYILYYYPKLRKNDRI